MIPETKLMRRVAGYHDLRLYGIGDLLNCARHASVMDIGCNRGLVGYEFFRNGATTVHGCDNYEEGITTARHIFCDLRNCKSRFEVVDLEKGPDALFAAFGKDYPERYDMVLMLATLHKLRREMPPAPLKNLLLHFAARAGKYFAWRAYTDDFQKDMKAKDEAEYLDGVLREAGLKKIQYSEISIQLGPAGIWAR